MRTHPTGLPELGADPSREYRLGIMGGTFDPIHYGHLVTAEQAREALQLDLVLFMPAGQPAFKQDQEVSDAEDRYAMTVLATAANPAFDASRFEIDRDGITYTIDTLRALRRNYPDNVKLFFITGADAILDLVTWHDAAAMAELATFIAATRPGYDIDQARQRVAASGVPFDVRYIEIPALAISSTNIRERVSRAKSVRYLTSESVIGYIRKNGLYNKRVVERVDAATVH
ncbi:nicotinate-nucleotide adenylyltransferase [Collinsella tanakaei]|uniref:nicotinate-nucleotide adenylyltransferase n=1 Tax=Collinsella tanakaei TaxID=626935 RepID=UPI0025A35456|nr:nicotinate-nucleotide adenylyltransferase [Collinsella tanakaei]MDM8301288.1 nicotinate-nucleotide adenylyltransferase [Collinsella tanakaei]